MHTKTAGDHRPVVIHDRPIKPFQCYKNQDVHIDSSLTWITHVNGVCLQLHQRLYILRRLRFYGVDQNLMCYVLSGCFKEFQIWNEFVLNTGKRQQLKSSSVWTVQVYDLCLHLVFKCVREQSLNSFVCVQYVRPAYLYECV